MYWSSPVSLEGDLNNTQAVLYDNNPAKKILWIFILLFRIYNLEPEPPYHWSPCSIARQVVQSPSERPSPNGTCWIRDVFHNQGTATSMPIIWLSDNQNHSISMDTTSSSDTLLGNSKGHLTLRSPQSVRRRIDADPKTARIGNGCTIHLRAAFPTSTSKGRGLAQDGAILVTVGGLQRAGWSLQHKIP